MIVIKEGKRTNKKITESAPNVLVTKAPKSTSCSGLPVDQSNSLRIGSSRQDAQTPLPPAHRKRTCFSLRSETENVCCEGGEITVLAICKADLNMTHTTGTSFVSYLDLSALHVNHVHFVPISYPQLATFGKAAANGLHGV